MRRVLAWAALTALLLAAAGGCGSKSYEFRLDQTLEEMRYRKRPRRQPHPAPKGEVRDDT